MLPVLTGYHENIRKFVFMMGSTFLGGEGGGTLGNF